MAMLALAVSGCRGPRDKGVKPGAGPGEMGDIDPLGGRDIEVGDREGIAGGDWQAGQFQPVFFDFDSARVGPSELPKLETVAQAVKGKGSKLVVEGHADERGTAEYNRALGERRALACREELVRLGVPSGDISTISYGEERPLEAGHDEVTWSKNRRCEFVVVTQ
ncbi:OmpA family protein [bacterium]|nr:OmpA family protein [bacterium]